jgi:cellobiose phosphorylase
VSVSGWITGTAGLMYNNMIKYFFGFQPGYTGVRFRPCLLEAWRSVSMVTNLRETQYRLKITKVDREKTTMVVNGTPTGSDFIPYRNEKIIDEEIRCK